MVKYSKKIVGGNWQEEDLQNAMKVVRTSRLSTNADAINLKIRRTLEHIWLKIIRVNLNWEGKPYLHHSRRKSYPRELLGSLKLVAP
jgi:hypothetical protein